MNTRMKLLAPAAALAVALGSTALAGQEGAPPAAPAASGATAIAFGRPIPVDVKSAGVEWKGHTYHLVRIGRAEFHLAEEGRLKAVLSAGITTFDDVDYEVHAAVFDAAGRLLGTAKAPCKVQRIWVGKTLLSAVKLELDFGVSRAYAQAKSFTLAVSDRKVLTPDDWQK
jgi:hypothetical protein